MQGGPARKLCCKTRSMQSLMPWIAYLMMMMMMTMMKSHQSQSSTVD